MTVKQNHKYTIAAVEQDDYLRQVIEKKLPQVCSSANFADLQFDCRTFKEIDNFEIDEKKDIDMLLLDYPLNSKDLNSQNLLDTLNKLTETKNLDSVVIISDTMDLELIANLKLNGVKDVIQKDDNFANRIWAIVYDDLKKHSKA